MTNRHIAQPWLADDRAQSLSSSVRGQPRLKKLNAYFPEHAQPIPLKFKMAAGRDDLSVCLLDVKDLPTDIPLLPLETDQEGVAVGKMVVMMGYPSGPDRLLALLDDAESRGIQQRYTSLEALLGYLAETRRIQPLTTQGISPILTCGELPTTHAPQKAAPALRFLDQQDASLASTLPSSRKTRLQTLLFPFSMAFHCLLGPAGKPLR